MEQLGERKSRATGDPLVRRFFKAGATDRGVPYRDLRWHNFKNLAPDPMFALVSEHVFPFLRTLGDGSTYSQYMRDARFTIPTAALLAKVVDLIAAVPMDDRDTKGDVYEYMLGKLPQSGQNGQFRTPHHIIRWVIKSAVEIAALAPTDILCDPAASTCGFLRIAGEYLRDQHPALFADPKRSRHFHHALFHGFEPACLSLAA